MSMRELNEALRRLAGRGRSRAEPPVPESHREINEAIRRAAGRVVLTADHAAINREIREAAGRAPTAPEPGDGNNDAPRHA